jgi:DNA-binding winged helix-turn-helix (wHTH) protein/tetratricopeptide (TPR) repeat protein
VSGDAAAVYEFGPFRLEPSERRLLREGEPVALTDKVFELLVALAENPGHALTKAELMKRLWPDAVVEESNLTVNVSVLRKALGESAGERRYIETVPRHGYRFIDAVRSVSRHGGARSSDGHAAAGHALEARAPNDAGAPERPRGAPCVTSPGAFVARESELSRLQAVWERACAGHGRLVLISGRPGMGKTTLCDRFLAGLSPADGAFFARGHCFESFGVVEPYLPFLEVLRELSSGPHRDVVATELRRHAPTWCVELPSALDAAVGAEVGAALASGVSSARLIREFADVLEALSASAPLLLVLEDVHWADPSSIDVLQRLALRVERLRVLVLATVRTEQAELENPPLKQLRRELLARDRADELKLPLLDEAGIASYLALRFAPHSFPDEFASLVARTTEGQPLFAARLLQMLTERGDIRRQQGSWSLAVPMDALRLDVPASLRGVIERELESLPEEDQRALRIASVAGVEFSSALVAALMDEDEVALEERLDRMARGHRLLDLLGEEALADGRLTLRYRFSHVLCRAVIYEQLASKRRTQLHAQIARLLLAHYASERVAVQVALQAEDAREYGLATEYWLRAADQAGRLHANREALEQYSRAITLLPHLEPWERLALSIILHYDRGWCYANQGDAEASVREFERMLELALAPALALDTPDAARALARVREYFAEPWRDVFGARELPRMPNQDVSHGPSAIAGEAYWGLCFALYRQGRLKALASRIGEFLATAQATHNEPRRVEALAWMALHAMEVQDVQRSIELADASIAAARALGHARALSLAAHMRARAHYRLAEYGAAAALLEECLELIAAGQTRLMFLLDLGLTRAKLGEFAAAMAALSEARNIAERAEQSEALIAVELVTGDLLLELGADERACACFRRALALSEQKLPRLEARALFRLARGLAQAADFASADAAFVRALERERSDAAASAADHDARAFRERIQSQQARTLYYLARGEAGRAAQHSDASADLERAAGRARELLELALAGPAVFQAALARLALARVALAQGDLRAAEAASRAGLAQLGDAPAAFLRCRLHAALGMTLLAAGQRGPARAALDAALDASAHVERSIDDDSLCALWMRSPLHERIVTSRAALGQG